MENYICVTCGTQFAETESAPENCPICEDERQYVNANGQQWTTLSAMKETHHNEIRELEPNLYGIGTAPSFAIGQRALLLQTPNGNLLWDCVSFLDEETITAVNALGGIRAIAISHPHFYSSAVEWAHAFDAPIYLHKNDQAHVMRQDPTMHFWEGDSKALWDGLTIIKAGGHFEGSSLLHWPAGANGNGAIFTGDTIMVVPDRRFVSFMQSFPNLIPLSPAKVNQIVASVAPYAFVRIYSAWWDRVMDDGGKTAVYRSAERYIQALEN